HQSGEKMSSKHRVDTGHHGVSCAPHLRPIGPPRNPMECGWSHIPSDFVVDHWTSAVDSSSPLDFLSIHAMWIPCGRLRSYKIMSIIPGGYNFTTPSGGICNDWRECYAFAY